MDKQLKRQETFNMAISSALTRDGQEFTLNNPTTRLFKILGMAQNSGIFIPGYMDNQGHTFKKVFGYNYPTFYQEALLENTGNLYTFSFGSGLNHMAIIIPKTPLLVKGIGSKELEITSKNFLDYPVITGRHGRLYNMARILAGSYNLLYTELPQGKYLLSNSHNFNMERGNGNTWEIWTGKGNLKPFPKTPLDYIKKGEKGIKELQKIIS